MFREYQIEINKYFSNLYEIKEINLFRFYLVNVSFVVKITCRGFCKIELITLSIVIREEFRFSLSFDQLFKVKILLKSID